MHDCATPCFFQEPALRNRIFLTLSRALCALSLAMALALAAPGAEAKPSIGTIELSALPKEGQATYRLIEQGGPFPYDKDGTTFGNREGVLAKQKRGYYREYTVKTPGAKNRGARRIVCGGNVEPARGERPKQHASQECYYTADHYANFALISK
jgi:ribonuclease T1